MASRIRTGSSAIVTVLQRLPEGIKRQISRVEDGNKNDPSEEIKSEERGEKKGKGWEASSPHSFTKFRASEGKIPSVR